jgi:hypothetical protein
MEKETLLGDGTDKGK